MQTQDDESDEGSRGADADAAERVLEDSHRVVLGPGPDQLSIYCNGAVTAVLEKHLNTRDLDSATPMLQARVYDFESLYWSHRGALLRLQGEHVLDILGLSICVLRGDHRPVWHPRPGMTGVRVVVPLFNPLGLQPLGIFQLATLLGF